MMVQCHTLMRSRRLAEEAARCLLCEEAPCTAACPSGDPAALLRALRFEDKVRASRLSAELACASCGGSCEKGCLREEPVRIRDLALQCALQASGVPEKEVDLSITFCGVKCENPFFLSSSVVAGTYDMCASALRMGWAGVVYKTIGFLIPDEVSPRFAAVRKEGTPFVGFRNLEQISDHPLAENLDALRRLKRDFPTKVIVASIMGRDEKEWTELARLCEAAGVDMIECNFSCPQMAGNGLGSDVGQDPELVKRYTRAVRRGTKLPVLAKMTPNLGHMEPPALAAVEGGADALAAINTVKSICGLDLDDLSAPPSIGGYSAVSGYSGKAVKPIALRFIHDLAVCPQLSGVPISGMGGIETWRDGAEFLALGCTNLQVTTSVMQYGYRIIDDLVSGLKGYLAGHGYENLDEFCGTALSRLVPPEQLDRASLSYPMFDRESCVGCGRCFVSCRDAGHDAIRFDKETRRPRLNGKKCVGCHLCRLVCPVQAIGATRRVPKRREAQAC